MVEGISGRRIWSGKLIRRSGPYTRLYFYLSLKAHIYYGECLKKIATQQPTLYYAIISYRFAKYPGRYFAAFIGIPLNRTS